MAFCENCGTPYEGSPAFCESCGSPLPRRQESAPASDEQSKHMSLLQFPLKSGLSHAYPPSRISGSDSYTLFRILQKNDHKPNQEPQGNCGKTEKGIV